MCRSKKFRASFKEIFKRKRSVNTTRSFIKRKSNFSIKQQKTQNKRVQIHNIKKHDKDRFRASVLKESKLVNVAVTFLVVTSTLTLVILCVILSIGSHTRILW